MDRPFKRLGVRLKGFREELHESIPEVSGAVEIDSDVLERIENGQERPSEDVLMLLMNHFGLQDNEAAKLWDMAGYDQVKNKQSSIFGDLNEDQQNRQVVMFMALDTRILYSDNVEINANKNGVVLNFLQNSGNAGQQMPIARVGMSHNQAQDFLRILEQCVKQAQNLNQPKALPAPKPKQRRTRETDNN